MTAQKATKNVFDWIWKPYKDHDRRNNAIYAVAQHKHINNYNFKEHVFKVSWSNFTKLRHEVLDSGDLTK
jgi:hypothetical protein